VQKVYRQTLLDVQPLTPSLFTLRTTRDTGFGSAQDSSPAWA
jgi:ferredoxin--NADP+ reductase